MMIKLILKMEKLLTVVTTGQEKHESWDTAIIANSDNNSKPLS